MQYPETVTIIDLAPAPFNNARDAITYAKSYGIVGVMSNADTGGIPLRAKTTIKRLLDTHEPQKAYTYEYQKSRF